MHYASIYIHTFFYWRIYHILKNKKHTTIWGRIYSILMILRCKMCVNSIGSIYRKICLFDMIVTLYVYMCVPDGLLKILSFPKFLNRYSLDRR